MILAIILVIVGFYSLRLEIDAGYYECKNCQHMFVPNYKEIALLMQTPTRRLLKCTKCGKWTWCKKLTKR